jgi:hypothetical protein
MSTGMTTAFDYGDLTEPEQRCLERAAERVRDIRLRVAHSAIEIGRELKNAHERFAHKKTGTFGRWVEECCAITPRHARNFIDAYEVFGEPNLDDSAMFLLSAPSCPEAARKEALKIADSGKAVTHKLAKSIVEKHTEKPAGLPSDYSPHGKPKPSKPTRTEQPKQEVPPAAPTPNPVHVPEITEQRRCSVIAPGPSPSIVDVLGSINATGAVIDRYASSDEGREVDAAKSASLIGQLKKAVAGGSRSHVIAADVEMPPPLNTKPCLEALDRWLMFKRKNGGSYKDANQVELQVKRWVEQGPEAFVAAVEYSIAQNYQGIHAEKSNGTKPTGQRSAPGSEYRPGDEDRSI